MPGVQELPTHNAFLAAAAVMQPKLVARPFNPDKPQLWFAQLETQFTDLGIVTEIDKYNKTVPLIDTVYAAEVEDLIIARPVNTPFQTLKNELIRCFTTPRSMNLLRLLDNENLGDRTPSKHLRHLKALVPGIDEEVLKTRWLSHLPEQTRATLAAQDDASLENLAKLADRVHEVFQPHQTAAISASSSNVVNSALRDELESLKATVAAMQLLPGKLQGELLATECSSLLTSRRLFVTDRSTKAQYLVDTGSDVSVCPRRAHSRKKDGSGYQLFAANNTLINTYGYIPILLDLGLRKEIKWRFIEADVSRYIIGADLLHHYGLLPDLKNQRLIDSTTGLSTDGQLVKFESFSVRLQTIEEDSSYVALLKKFPAITKPEGLLRNTKHMTQHHIRTTPGPPVSARPRRLLPNKLAIAKAEFSNMQKLGIARRGQGPWSSPLHLTPKKNREWRPCGDYRGLNDRTIPDKYPVRYLEDFVANLYGSTIFSTIDLVKVFNQVPVAAEDIQKAAIITPFGLFEFPFMTFGLRNAAQTLQRLINEVTRDLPFLFPYIDDILVASETPEQHLDHLRQLFQRLEDFGLVFTSDIVHVAGDDNVVADALSRIEAVSQAIDNQQLAQSQREDLELRQLLEGFKDCLTIIDRFTRYPEVVPLPDIRTETVVRALLYHWIARFGVPLRITSDRGGQFIADIYRRLTEMLGIRRKLTTPIHPQANGLVERLHRQLKAALLCHGDSWYDVLPLVLLALRTAWKPDVESTPAEFT
ncbi:uncharacterized protein LOC107046298 [Diachasma alloeum]|uniref:uncharacterized protein LOC107046298 n=1 Tax=Diachasma alloeum TaxID=454923 RepID=UPI0007382DA7|nr:uncharacterized protein LOC107046298 [Diachasma alloeum]